MLGMRVVKRKRCSSSFSLSYSSSGSSGLFLFGYRHLQSGDCWAMHMSYNTLYRVDEKLRRSEHIATIRTPI